MREVENYWQALRSADKVPARSQIDPRGMEGALEYAFLAERIAPGMAKIRVAGSHLSDLMGMEVSGMPLSSLFAPSAREALARDIARVFAEPAILRAYLRGEEGFGKPEISGQLLILPLRSDMGDITRALGCLITRGRVGRAPRRFLIGSSEVTPVFHKAAIIPEKQPETATETQKKPALIPVSELHAPKAPKVVSGHISKRSHLRIVVSND
ncbi:MAG: PAS domain-containing protein [Rhodobacterales bacterium]|uniref:PAS domain-containing protein n=1 Tax=Puniceibacterium antarcticum TaxID=1206336 RepID=UPI001FE933D9|nr:PAS domain-containing protein [Puniceibacterium antarcticum]